MAIDGINVVDAIGSLYRGDYFSATDVTDSEGNRNPIVWKDGHTTTSAEQDAIDAELIRLQAEYDSQTYSRNRLAEYPTIQECVHAILDDDLDALQVLRQAVKDKYPKP